ncbi:response regulator [Azospirillum sp. ST 5-10]|uniref:response regulator n=1 Tax=unclassified Azospirillum TaxID=2630922 RepID=UPI003F49BCA2
MTHTIAIVDDDAVTRDTLGAYFGQEGFTVLPARDADGLSAILARHGVDLVLLDIRLPGKDGLTITRELRATSDVGIILITGRTDRVDRIIGLELGADDYITKPFEPREILARSRSLLRRMAQAAPLPAANVHRFDGWELRLDTRRLTAPDGTEVRLTTAEFDLLAAFVVNAGRVLSRDALLDLTRHRADPFDRSVDRLVLRLRRILEPDPAKPRHIVTVHGSGYVFASAVAG